MARGRREINTQLARRQSDDSTFSHVVVPENESIETAPPLQLTPELGSETNKDKADKLKRKRRMVKYTSLRITGKGTSTDDAKEVVELGIHMPNDGTGTHTHGSTSGATTTSYTIHHVITDQHRETDQPGT